MNVSFRLGFQTGSEIFRKSAVEFIKVRRRFVFPKKMDFCGPANGERDTGVISEWDCVLWIKLHHWRRWKKSEHTLVHIPSRRALSCLI